MARTVPTIVLLTLLASSCILSANVEASKDYDNYAFALEWAGTVCQFKNCVDDRSIAGYWNIHGLWPDANNGHHPFYCTKTGLDWVNLPQSLQTDIPLFWSGLYSSQQQFLDHEWTKHGTCWRPDYGNMNNMPASIKPIVEKARSAKQSSSNFINLVIELSKNVYAVHDILAAGGVTPSSSQKYTLDTINLAISTGFGKGNVNKFKINCMRDESGQSYFSDVMLCLNKDYQPMDCVCSVKSSCPASGIVYPPRKKKLIHSQGTPTLF